ncbi:N-acetylglucosamine-1-phosphodiester alpha-N-acetylglucosaminidase [Triplophysa rosa]|uniref:N-acetylglucosamine-1-phosphodiester alpha-N-acetylglucosaminidase n=1 Tax=Triplophysa rosa TaxID=992332 RepID=A0A9W7WRG5_TRIRA|nr:N-acetylglucosamine-1-phosphodiester alpha-N-acetylglucosaminidase [Triplophysa rosa]KAI7806992.1 putative N-acetylglucosamine-1-phosphodiester alpha-N-acetylglucosaminidase [Triplophysa rosa]
MATSSVNFEHIFLFVLCLRACGLSQCKDIRNSLDEDLLLPYTKSHGPSHSHRHVRDCQSIAHGNVTHETWAASKHSNSPVVESKIFVSSIPDDTGTARWKSGHITVVHDPLRTVSILEPGGPGGCEQNHKELVEVTAKTKKCLVAQNGGFFKTDTGVCLGNVVSDGKLVRNSGGVQNAQFGIRKDGTLVFGYLSEEDVLDQVNPFIQLISGVVWLLRAGEIYIHESIQAECDKTQETGKFQYFVDVVSARTAVGHDAEGKLILFHVDGQTGNRGMNLRQVAKFLKDQGVINAINLDGGGSATYILNGSLASYPSDHCTGGMWCCPRAVSTVLCVHERLCQLEDCSGHGRCIDGQCECQQGWSGPGCANLTCQSPECGDHGICTENGCVCDSGWRGLNCSQVCESGFYGDGCNQSCKCANGGSCDPVHGQCTCRSGFHGDSCKQECLFGFYGLNCEQPCQCENMCPCDSVTGSCNTTYEGERNISLHRAGHCLATQLWREWRHVEESQTPRPYLSEQSWLVVCAILATSLLASLAGNLIQTCRKCRARGQREGYSYFPLGEINGAAERGRGQRTKPGKNIFQAEDSDSS